METKKRLAVRSLTSSNMDQIIEMIIVETNECPNNISPNFIKASSQVKIGNFLSYFICPSVSMALLLIFYSLHKAIEWVLQNVLCFTSNKVDFLNGSTSKTEGHSGTQLIEELKVDTSKKSTLRVFSPKVVSI